MDASWREAITATRHCLTGCAIGEVLGMVVATGAGWGDAASIAVSVVLAFFFGYLLTFSGQRRAGVALGPAVRIALAADTVSILVMEVVDNGILVGWPSAMEAGLGDVLFWGSLAVSLAVAFVVTVPVNRAMIARGLGHARAHAAHAGHGSGHGPGHGSGHGGHHEP
ncbi:DUF4396 domain-containing protein [Nocardioides halotolerans]|uniref:DUF4396 domain-containing protein n=1 Tax=Nocardioides halotolerans TaxID=433660 RepID=UPI000426B938|nr:DUF4396 domain-containing protein [Nocardioides halotolerans]